MSSFRPLGEAEVYARLTRICFQRRHALRKKQMHTISVGRRSSLDDHETLLSHFNLAGVATSDVNRSGLDSDCQAINVSGIIGTGSNPFSPPRDAFVKRSQANV